MNKGLTRSTLIESFLVTAKSSAMIFFIILGAAFYNGFLALTQVPQEISNFVVSQGFSPWVVLSLILLFYLVFGCLMDSLSMILLTIPIFFPVIVELDFGMSQEHIAIWFGILVLIVGGSRTHYPSRRHEPFCHQCDGSQHALGADL
jgi:TRAP-type C4-dicarboxylate transport system permease large subunit